MFILLLDIIPLEIKHKVTKESSENVPDLAVMFAVLIVLFLVNVIFSNKNYGDTRFRYT